MVRFAVVRWLTKSDTSDNENGTTLADKVCLSVRSRNVDLVVVTPVFEVLLY